MHEIDLVYIVHAPVCARPYQDGVHPDLQEASDALGAGVLDLVLERLRRCNASSAGAVCASYFPAKSGCDVSDFLQNLAILFYCP